MFIFELILAQCSYSFSSSCSWWWGWWGRWIRWWAWAWALTNWCRWHRRGSGDGKGKGSDTGNLNWSCDWWHFDWWPNNFNWLWFSVWPRDWVSPWLICRVFDSLIELVIWLRVQLASVWNWWRHGVMIWLIWGGKTYYF